VVHESPAAARAAEPVSQQVVPMPTRWKDLCLHGSRFGSNEVAEASARLRANPDDLETRLLLIGAGTERTAHVLWLIAHQPRADIGLFGLIGSDTAAYAEGRTLWRAATQRSPGDATIAANAALYLALADPDEAEVILVEGRRAHPNDPEWSRRLAMFCEHLMMRAAVGNDSVEKDRLGELALRSYLDVFAAEPDLPRRLDLIWPMRQSVSATRSPEISALLQLADREGRRAVNVAHAQVEREHFAHMACGLVALVRDDVEGAERELLAAPLSGLTAAPSMALANALLRRHRTSAVLAYLGACQQSLDATASTVKDWIDAIRRGEAPDLDHVR